MAAGIPSVQVWFGKEAAGIDGAVTWVDITTYVRLEAGLTETRGSSYGAGAQPGSFTLVLENTDGTFTAGNAGSSLYPYVQLQALVKVWRDGRPWFVGRIQSMPMTWPTGGDSIATVTVTLADRLSRFERLMLGSFPVEEIVHMNPAAYYPMSEAAGSIQAASSTSYWPLVLVTPGDGTIAFAGATGPAGDGVSSPMFTPGTRAAYLLSSFAPFGIPYSGATGEWTISAAFATTSGGLISRFTTMYNGNSYNIDVTVELNGAAPGIMVRRYDPNSVSFFSRWHFPAAVMDGGTHSVQVMDSIGFLGAYIDGVPITATALGPVGYWSNTAQQASLRVGSVSPLGAPFTSIPPFAGTISHVALWNRALTSTEAAQINAALITTLTTQAAMLKILGWRGQAAGALIDAGVVDQLPSSVLGRKSLAATLGDINASEAGTLFVDGQDRVTWRNRRAALSPQIAIPAFDVDPGIAYNCDMQRIQTVVTAQTQKGGAIVAQSVDFAAIGVINGSVTALTNDFGDALAHASWVANTGPRGPYIGSLKIDMTTCSAATYTAVTSGGILTKVTLTGMPSQAPPGSTVLEVIGETETISATGWDVTWMTLPAGIGSARDVLILGDATYGVLDSTHKLAY